MSAALQIPGFCVRAEPWRCLDFCSFHCKIQVIGERWGQISAKNPEQEREQDVVGTTATGTSLGAQRRDQKGGEVDRGWPVVASSCLLHRASLFWACWLCQAAPESSPSRLVTNPNRGAQTLLLASWASWVPTKCAHPVDWGLILILDL